jgi:Protein of unknown function (DUF1566)
MKRIFGVTVALAMLAVFLSSAQAAIKIEIAEVQNGFAFVKGNGAERGALITWEGNAVTTANNNNGGFSFDGAVPADCIGALSDGMSTINVQVLNCTPVSADFAPVPRTGQTTSFDTNTTQRDDGALEMGVPLPTPRFIKNVNAVNDTGVGVGGIAGNGICDGTETCNGTITDQLTGLIWLQNANCPGERRAWQTALNDVVSLNLAGTMNSNNCGDTSNAGIHQTDWRLPNVRELHSLVNFAFVNPAMSNAAGTAIGSSSDPFSNFQVTSGYWSSTTGAGNPANARSVGFAFGSVDSNVKTVILFVTAVRGGS